MAARRQWRHRRRFLTVVPWLLEGDPAIDRAIGGRTSEVRRDLFSELLHELDLGVVLQHREVAPGDELHGHAGPAEPGPAPRSFRVECRDECVWAYRRRSSTATTSAWIPSIL